MTAAIRQDLARETLERRQAAADTLAALEAEGEAVLPGLQAALSEAEGALKAHDQARQAIVDRIRGAKAALLENNGRIDRARAGAKAILTETAPAELDQAIQFFRDKHEEIRQQSVKTDRAKAGKDLLHERQGLHLRSNYGAICEALAFCRRALSELEGMKMAPAPDLRRVEDLKRGIPRTDRLDEVDGSRPLTRGAETVPELMKLPTASQTDWAVGRVLERVEKWRRKIRRR